MTDSKLDAASARLRLAIEMYEVGESIMLAKLRREHVGASGEELEARIREWLHARPGAPFGDAKGKSVSRSGIRS